MTSLLYSCQKFSQNMMTGVLSEQRNKCSALTKEFKDENVFDYAQATKCCSGEESGYCDLMKDRDKSGSVKNSRSRASGTAR
ncbi:MAG: hypothetical protein H7326_11270 [Bdellovibrionaceae bacterium]|nr:hypothetical protein [Pseudobdellovibrionaceae bacterium]